MSPYDDPAVSAGELADYLYCLPYNSPFIPHNMQPEVTASIPEALSDWAIVEIMGHEKLAGQVSQASVAGMPMLRVQVPATDKAPGFERLLSGPSIFSLTPVTESVARIVVASLQKTAVSGLPAYGFSQVQQLELRQALGLPAPEATPRYGDRDDDPRSW
jgi:hypothetical protein